MKSVTGRLIKAEGNDITIRGDDGEIVGFGPAGKEMSVRKLGSS